MSARGPTQQNTRAAGETSRSGASPETSWRYANRDRALAVVAHELRQPLSVIRFNAGALQRLPEATKPTHIRSIAQAIERAIESQTRIIDDLLDFSRAQIGKLTLRRVEVDFGTLVTELVETFSANLAAGRVRLERVPPRPLICYADRAGPGGGSRVTASVIYLGTLLASGSTAFTRALAPPPRRILRLPRTIP